MPLWEDDPTLQARVRMAGAQVDAARATLAHMRGAVLKARAHADASKVLDPDDPMLGEIAAVYGSAQAAYLEALHFTLPQALMALEAADNAVLAHRELQVSGKAQAWAEQQYPEEWRAVVRARDGFRGTEHTRASDYQRAKYIATEAETAWQARLQEARAELMVAPMPDEATTLSPHHEGNNA